MEKKKKVRCAHSFEERAAGACRESKIKINQKKTKQKKRGGRRSVVDNRRSCIDLDRAAMQKPEEGDAF